MSKIVKFGGGFIVICAVLAMISLLFVPRPAKLTGQHQSSPSAAPQIRVSALDLSNAYHANEVAADEKFKGKQILATGTIQSIDKDFKDGIVVRLRTDNKFMPVDADVDNSEVSIAAKLSIGGQISVRCIGGGMIIGRPRLKSCKFDL